MFKDLGVIFHPSFSSTIIFYYNPVFLLFYFVIFTSGFFLTTIESNGNRY